VRREIPLRPGSASIPAHSDPVANPSSRRGQHIAARSLGSTDGRQRRGVSKPFARCVDRRLGDGPPVPRFAYLTFLSSVAEIAGVAIRRHDSPTGVIDAMNVRLAKGYGEAPVDDWVLEVIPLDQVGEDEVEPLDPSSTQLANLLCACSDVARTGTVVRYGVRLVTGPSRPPFTAELRDLWKLIRRASEF
jgi:hypothetical protein